jgi:hypothetical protein
MRRQALCLDSSALVRLVHPIEMSIGTGNWLMIYVSFFLCSVLCSVHNASGCNTTSLCPTWRVGLSTEDITKISTYIELHAIYGRWILLIF